MYVTSRNVLFLLSTCRFCSFLSFCVSLISLCCIRYLIGTEDGSVHRCSASYTDAFLTSHFFHQGPIYQLAYNHVCPDVFLTCSADWRLALWNGAEGEEARPFVLKAASSPIVDAAWCPQSACMLASLRCVFRTMLTCDQLHVYVCLFFFVLFTDSLSFFDVYSEEKLYIWNLAEAEQDPTVIEVPVEGTHLTRVAFNPVHPVVAVSAGPALSVCICLMCLPGWR